MKIQLILLLYDELLMGKSIERSDFCKEHKISERTFYRYLHELTDFLRAYKQAYIVDMREPGGRYYLKKIVDLERLTDPVSAYHSFLPLKVI